VTQDGYRDNFGGESLGDAPVATRVPAEGVLAALVVVLLLVGSLVVVLPFVSALAWAFVMSFSLWPVYRRFVARLGGRRTLAALVMTTAIAGVLVVPTIVAVANLADDAAALADAANQWVASGPPPAPQWLRKMPVLGARGTAYWDALAGEANRLVRKARDASAQQQQQQEQEQGVASLPPATTAPTPRADGEAKAAALLAGIVTWTRRWIAVAALAVVQGATHLLLSVFLTFFIFRDGAALGHRVGIATRRIGGEQGLRLVDVAASTVRGVVYGILGTALVQGVMAGVGLFIAGVPGAALLGLVTFFLSAVPRGPPLVWAPATIWLFHQGHAGWGTFMLLWGLAVSSIDNVIKPLIISHGSATPFILILLGVIGGALTFGFIGVFLGPTLLAVCYRMIEQWSRGGAAPQPLARPTVAA
jgi:predicted PurR-regulated permease PerM